MSQNSRKIALTSWLSEVTDTENMVLAAMSGDAGFRKYYRAKTSQGQSVIVVDSPVDKCNNPAFIAIQQSFRQQEIATPDVIAVDEAQGFFCLSDLGDTLLADKLTTESMQVYYRRALDIIPKISCATETKPYQLPLFDRKFIAMELNIFSEWLVERYLKLEGIDKQKLQVCFDVLIDNAVEQPQMVMHRDFHSRNIMLNSDNELAVIDFQDAVVGPITYDIVSLLRDCYVKWPDEQVYGLLKHFVTQYADSHYQLPTITFTQWQRWFDLVGLQRHVKVAGIFARLYLRDDKPGYLPDIPLTLQYIKEVSAHYDELTYLHDVMVEHVIPALEAKS